MILWRWQKMVTDPGSEMDNFPFIALEMRWFPHWHGNCNAASVISSSVSPESRTNSPSAPQVRPKGNTEQAGLREGQGNFANFLSLWLQQGADVVLQTLPEASLPANRTATPPPERQPSRDREAGSQLPGRIGRVTARPDILAAHRNPAANRILTVDRREAAREQERAVDEVNGPTGREQAGFRGQADSSRSTVGSETSPTRKGADRSAAEGRSPSRSAAGDSRSEHESNQRTDTEASTESSPGGNASHPGARVAQPAEGEASSIDVARDSACGANGGIEPPVLPTSASPAASDRAALPASLAADHQRASGKAGAALPEGLSGAAPVSEGALRNLDLPRGDGRLPGSGGGTYAGMATDGGGVAIGQGDTSLPQGVVRGSADGEVRSAQALPVAGATRIAAGAGSAGNAPTGAASIHVSVELDQARGPAQNAAPSDGVPAFRDTAEADPLGEDSAFRRDAAASGRSVSPWAFREAQAPSMRDGGSQAESREGSTGESVENAGILTPDADGKADSLSTSPEVEWRQPDIRFDAEGSRSVRSAASESLSAVPAGLHGGPWTGSGSSVDRRSNREQGSSGTEQASAAPIDPEAVEGYGASNGEELELGTGLTGRIREGGGFERPQAAPQENASSRSPETDRAAAVTSHTVPRADYASGGIPTNRLSRSVAEALVEESPVAAALRPGHDPLVARSLRVDLPGTNGEDAMRLRFLQRGGGAGSDIDVRIQTPSERVLSEMRTEIPALLHRLEQAGFRTAGALPDAASNGADERGSSRDSSAERKGQGSSGSQGEPAFQYGRPGKEGGDEKPQRGLPGNPDARHRIGGQSFGQSVSEAIAASRAMVGSEPGSPTEGHEPNRAR